MQVKRQLRRLTCQLLVRVCRMPEFVGVATSKVSPTREYEQPVPQCSPCFGRWYGSKDPTWKAGLAPNARGSSTLLILLRDRR